MKACLHNKLNFSNKTTYGGRGATLYGTDYDGVDVHSTSYDDYYRTSYGGTCISDYNSILEERYKYIKYVIESQHSDFVPIAPEELVTQHKFEHNADYSYTHRTFHW